MHVRSLSVGCVCGDLSGASHTEGDNLMRPALRTDSRSRTPTVPSPAVDTSRPSEMAQGADEEEKRKERLSGGWAPVSPASKKFAYVLVAAAALVFFLVSMRGEGTFAVSAAFPPPTRPGGPGRRGAHGRGPRSPVARLAAAATFSRPPISSFHLLPPSSLSSF